MKEEKKEEEKEEKEKKKELVAPPEIGSATKRTIDDATRVMEKYSRLREDFESRIGGARGGAVAAW